MGTTYQGDPPKNCCSGLVCHTYQHWKCVEDKYQDCAGVGTYARECVPEQNRSNFKGEAPKCCSHLVCEEHKCVLPDHVSVLSTVFPDYKQSQKPISTPK